LFEAMPMSNPTEIAQMPKVKTREVLSLNHTRMKNFAAARISAYLVLALLLESLM